MQLTAFIPKECEKNYHKTKAENRAAFQILKIWQNKHNVTLP